jgi:uncharacterized damage-inducible protein DinB
MPDLLQPVAHALLQVREELDEILMDFPDSQLWEKPAGVASPGFHLQHLSGVLDRLFTYARGEALTAAQLQALAAEGAPGPGKTTVRELVQQFHRQADRALAQLQATDSQTLAQVRTVGRSQLPSTLMGLYVHAAEHSTRHLGQLLVTVRILRHQVARHPEI